MCRSTRVQLAPAECASPLFPAGGSSREQCQQLLRSSLLQLCSAAPAAGDASATCLSPDAVSVMAASFTRGLLQHFSLYQLVFTQQQAHTQHQLHLPVRPAAALCCCGSE
eukprot:GHRQ01014111.1.p7 GENE.GHRQ01014111.1~~GHRQ01014111.1.p7  ORF type:complete len:110 (+),score=45.36 GHRQ01014111.1:2105-2434(+)